MGIVERGIELGLENSRSYAKIFGGSQERRTAEERKADGKALRKLVPRSSHAQWNPPADRQDPVALIRSQEQTRLQDLLPVRHERMAASPFAYFRGAALPMAADLCHTPTTNINVQLCGDAHIANFGVFGTPERHLVFDINDFDETLPGPWEYDVKRLATSIELCGRDRKFDARYRQDAVLTAVGSYRQAMAKFAKMGAMQVYYEHVDVDELLRRHRDAFTDGQLAALRRRLDKIRDKNSARAIDKLTETVDGRMRIKSNPPLVVPMRDMQTQRDIREASLVMRRALFGYMRSLSPERRNLLEQYEAVDAARKVVGVGSVGTRCWIVVMQGPQGAEVDPLVLQIKEANESVLEPYLGKSRSREHGQRVVEGQRAIQTAGDIMLGWTSWIGDDGRIRDFYLRQLWDSKGSPDLDDISVDGLVGLSRLCGWALAHAHARTGDRFMISGYLGKGDAFDRAVADFAAAYADQNDRDYQAFVACLKV